ncbi:hypothetical protein M404DRAFT_176166 [Pisolithus tinctorius Marx 270]|uniref:Uncharacterized protein n=1 Tax=Pisolithus tinctorius Marx 270 TaxID=870435 RepID=A0A0C3JZE0_PISTI|nr:hypothetical protein M404DRAFT_176166 [Pisolithus tinctorius Marx 270]
MLLLEERKGVVWNSMPRCGETLWYCEFKKNRRSRLNDITSKKNDACRMRINAAYWVNASTSRQLPGQPRPPHATVTTMTPREERLSTSSNGVIGPKNMKWSTVSRILLLPSDQFIVWSNDEYTFSVMCREFRFSVPG